ncbi:hypothetical protein E3N88_20766 [Mikania micrantha]|uniref:Uncharacterized protein n=1 Tax=Mikania micrantha TaxID=192012 RepID=A0A5N6NJT1_9ASTR|nr:hypothetical protein E3N88_20766 [Mikania micrantha]
MASASSLQLPVTIPLSSASNAEQIFPSKNISLIGFSGKKKWWGIQNSQNCVGRVMSESKDPSKLSDLLQIGSPIIIVEAPKMLKTAASVPCLKVNSGLVKAGDVGRQYSRICYAITPIWQILPNSTEILGYFMKKIKGNQVVVDQGKLQIEDSDHPIEGFRRQIKGFQSTIEGLFKATTVKEIENSLQAIEVAAASEG